MSLEVLVAQLQTGGPWALLALSLLGLAYVFRMYVRVRDEHDKAQMELLSKYAEMSSLQAQTLTAFNGQLKEVEDDVNEMKTMLQGRET